MSPRIAAFVVQPLLLSFTCDAVFSKDGLDVSKVLSDPGSVFEDHLGSLSGYFPALEDPVDPCEGEDCSAPYVDGDGEGCVDESCGYYGEPVDPCEGEDCDVPYVEVEECEGESCGYYEDAIPVEPEGCETGGCYDGDHPILILPEDEYAPVEHEEHGSEHPILIHPDGKPIPVEPEGCETGACLGDHDPILLLPGHGHPEESYCSTQVQDAYCQDLNGAASYCKFYKYPQVCQFGDQPCSCGDIHGKSECAHACPEIYSPLCGSDGVTYSNECVFEKMKCEHGLRHGYDFEIYVAYKGECHEDKEKECDGFCTREYKPICGSDGVTYSNGCEFEIHQCKDHSLEFGYDGECVKPNRCRFFAPCTEEYNPVCGSDGVTYDNPCYFQMAQCEEDHLELAYESACYEEPEPCIACLSTAYVPVCGSDGVTYDNECYLYDAACAAGGKISVAHRGACEDEKYDGCYLADCVGTYALICGSDGVTYPGSCAFLEAQCRDRGLHEVSC